MGVSERCRFGDDKQITPEGDFKPAVTQSERPTRGRANWPLPPRSTGLHIVGSVFENCRSGQGDPLAGAAPGSGPGGPAELTANRRCQCLAYLGPALAGKLTHVLREVLAPEEFRTIEVEHTFNFKPVVGPDRHLGR